MKIKRFVVSLIVGLCERILKRVTPKPIDFGKHNILVLRDDGSHTPMGDDELWDMMDELDEHEKAQENWWLVTFAKAARQYGEGIYAHN